MNTTSSENLLLAKLQFEKGWKEISAFMSPKALPSIEGQDTVSPSMIAKMRSNFAQDRKKLLLKLSKELKGQKVVGVTKDDGLSA